MKETPKAESDAMSGLRRPVIFGAEVRQALEAAKPEVVINQLP
ncbi:MULTISPECIES: hypothetical protein [unclassified Rhizobium]|jgi:hypothetical protein|nr:MULTISPECIES: hypothetical protein [unclassified Rhizobium]MBB3542596.1 hypothetical protein [Rhizobium sp. BK399]MCS3739395.1 hypothetical protein [Rhizobium sp. BK661]MCS4091422.1 hypothetical protein [Rhizobium sp. BK176]